MQSLYPFTKEVTSRCRRGGAAPQGQPRMSLGQEAIGAQARAHRA